MLEALGGRKFLLTLIVISVGTAVQILSPHGVTAEFTALLVGTTAAFGGANAVITHKAMSMVSQAPQPESPDQQPSFDPAPIVARIDETQLALSAVKAGLDAHSQTLAGLQQGNELTQKLLKTAISVK